GWITFREDAPSLPARVDPHRLVPPDLDLACRRAAAFADIAGAAEVDGDLAARLAGLGVPRREFGGAEYDGAGGVVYPFGESDDDVAPGVPRGVEPEIPGAGHAEGELVVLAGALPAQDLVT